MSSAPWGRILVLVLVGVACFAAPATAQVGHRAKAVPYVIVRHSKYCHVTINARTGRVTFRASKGHYGRFTVVVRHGRKLRVYHFTRPRPHPRPRPAPAPVPPAGPGAGPVAGSGPGQPTVGYTRPPSGSTNQWYWELSPSQPGLAGLPSTSGAYPAPGSANIWDTDLFQDSNTANAGIPTGPSAVVGAIHSAGHYSICYVEVGAYQVGFPDDSNFAQADYGGVGDAATQMQGYPNEYWFDLTGFRNYVSGRPETLTGAAINIAAALNERFAWCKLEGQDAVEPDDLDGYTNKSTSGVTPWGMTQADSAGFERWLAYDIHRNGLAAFQKNDPANGPADATLFDGMIIEECNYYNDPCAGSGGDATTYLAAGKPVLNAEYTSDGETTAAFCASDEAAGIAGALFDVGLDGKSYHPCRP